MTNLHITHGFKVYRNFSKDFDEMLSDIQYLHFRMRTGKKLETIFMEAAEKTECHHSLDSHGKLCQPMNLKFQEF